MGEIHTAVERGRTSRIAEILRADPVAASRPDSLNDQPLHIAAWHGRARIAELLLDAGAPINARGDRGRMPLHYAAENRRQKVLALLLRRGADSSAEDDAGCTPLYHAVSVGDTATRDVLLANGAVPDLRSAVYLDGPDAALARLTGDPVPISAEQAQRVLGDAVRVGSVELVSRLLDLGADPNRPSFGEMPPLLQAVSEHQARVVQALLSRGASVAVRDHIGRPILEFCRVYRAPPEIVELLTRWSTAG